MSILVNVYNTFFLKSCTYDKNSVINKDMSKPLVIVESPTKVKTISKILGPEYIVKSSVGHIRDLPRNTKTIPANFSNKEIRKIRKHL